MKRALVAGLLGLSITLGAVGVASADPSPDHYPTNPNACVGNSSTSANHDYQDADPDKLRSDQAREDDGQLGRADEVAAIPQCVSSGNDRGHVQ